MPQECTALATVWPQRQDSPEAHYELWENFRPVWHAKGHGKVIVPSLTYPIAGMLALHLARLGVVAPAVPRDDRGAHEIYARCGGVSVSIVRYRGSIVSGREMPCLTRSGVRVDLLDVEDIAASGRHL